MPAAFLICALALWALAFFMGKPAHRAEAPPIEAQIIEQSVQNDDIPLGRLDAPFESKQEPPPALTPPEQAPPPKPVVKPKPKAAPHHPQPAPVLHAGPEATPNSGATAPGAEVASSPNRDEQGRPGSETSADTQFGSPYGSSTSKGELHANSGAHAIVKPLPQIPDDLRREAFSSSVRVRFRVAADGSVEVELTQPSQNVRLNRIVLDSLKKWRFMPALKNGMPVPSVEEILVKLEVK
jgi:protein TonB